MWLEFGWNWVLFQSILEQEGYANMGMFLMSFSNMGAIFSIQHVYIISDTWTGLSFQSHTLQKANHPVCIAIMDLLLGEHLLSKGYV